MRIGKALHPFFIDGGTCRVVFDEYCHSCQVVKRGAGDFQEGSHILKRKFRLLRAMSRQAVGRRIFAHNSGRKNHIAYTGTHWDGGAPMTHTFDFQGSFFFVQHSESFIN